MTEQKTSARECAVRVLYSSVYEGGYSNILLNHIINKSRLSEQDRSFCTEMVYGVLQNLLLIDFYISKFSSLKMNNISPMVMTILRVGIYQILFLDRIPPSAACNEAVKLTKKYANPNASGFVNGMLRSIVRNMDNLPSPDSADFVSSLSIRCSLEPWIIRSWIQDYGRETAAALSRQSLSRQPTVISQNTVKTSVSELIRSVSEDGGALTKIEDIDKAFYLDYSGDISGMRSFREGLFHVVGLASQLCVKVLNPLADETVMDICAAPGGKTFLISEGMQNRGKVYAFDLYPKKIEELIRNAGRLGLTNITAQLADGKYPLPEHIGQADKVLVDALCSGLGIIAKKPDIKLKKEKEIEPLPALQYAILRNAAAYVKPGGELVYSTCTLKKAENEEIVERFIRENEDYELCGFEHLLPDRYRNPDQKGMITLMPHTHNTEGFFISKIRRKA